MTLSADGCSPHLSHGGSASLRHNSTFGSGATFGHSAPSSAASHSAHFGHSASLGHSRRPPPLSTTLGENRLAHCPVAVTRSSNTFDDCFTVLLARTQCTRPFFKALLLRLPVLPVTCARYGTAAGNSCMGVPYHASELAACSISDRLPWFRDSGGPGPLTATHIGSAGETRQSAAGRGLPVAEGGSGEFSSADFAALLALGTAGIRAIPHRNSRSTSASPPSPPKPAPLRMQPLDAAAFGGNCAPAAAKHSLPLLSRPGAAAAGRSSSPATLDPAAISAQPGSDQQGRRSDGSD